MNQENQLKNPPIQVNKDEYNKDKKFPPKITSPALELTNTQDGNIGPHLQVRRVGTHLNGVGSELTIFFAQISLFCYSWFCNRRSVWTEHPHTRLFLDTFILVQSHHIVAQGAARRVCIRRCSCTSHHMSERLLFPCFVFFLCLSCLHFLSHFYLFSVLNFNLHDVEHAEY